MKKKIAIALTIFPGSLFVLALASYIVCSIAELGLASGSANIGLGLLCIAVLINIPTFIAWGLYFATRGSGQSPHRQGKQSAEHGGGGQAATRTEAL